MNQELKKAFETDVDKASWDMLKTHYDRNALFVVDEGVDLIEVCVAVATDNVERIKTLQESQLLRPPNEEETSKWKEDPKKDVVEFLIVQPYVFIKEIQIN